MDSNRSLTRMHSCAAATALGLVLAAGGVTAAQADPPRQAKPRGTQSQAHKPRAQGDYTRHTEVQRRDHGHLRTDTWTGADGRSATRNAEVVNDRADRTRTRNVERTGPNGEQATRTDVTQRTGSGYTRSSVARGPQGGTVKRDVAAAHDPATGTWTRDVSVDRTAPPADGG